MPDHINSAATLANGPTARGDVAGHKAFAALFASGIAVLGWTALVVDFSRWLAFAISAGRGIVVATVTYFRYFTVLTNLGVAILMTVAALALWRRRAPPDSRWFRGALVYMIVTCITYELLLRRLWSPQGLQFWTDLAFHDIQPALTLIFWVTAAPKRDLHWRDLPILLPYPIIYFALALVIGARGGGYPYDFLDVTALGYPRVITIGLAFLAVFLLIGALVTATAHRIAGGITGDRSETA